MGTTMIKKANSTPTIAPTGVLLAFVAPVGVTLLCSLLGPFVAVGEGELREVEELGDAVVAVVFGTPVVELKGVRVGTDDVVTVGVVGTRELGTMIVMLGVKTGVVAAEEGEGNGGRPPIVVERLGGRSIRM